jgi:FkbM family methyltransferase
MLNKLKSMVSDFLLRYDRTIVRSPLRQYLKDLDIDVVLDVGANIGQFGRSLRRLGYKGKIVSFEPLSSAFEGLTRSIGNDPRWTAVQIGLGNVESQVEINISANNPSSSILPLHNSSLENNQVKLEYIGRETIRIRRLDGIFADVTSPCLRPFVKIDTQGFERQVMEGANGVLPSITAIQLELSLVLTYEGESLIEEMITLLRDKGFVPFWISHGYRDAKTQQLFQVDVFFVNERAAKSLNSRT